MSRLEDATLPFDQHVKQVFQEVRVSLSDLMLSVGSDPSRPQEAARQLGIHKNLAWKVSRIIREMDPATALSAMPGREGLNIFLRAIEKSGAHERSVTAARNALAEFERMISIHSGDRDTLELMLSGLSQEADAQRSEALRKLSYRGNSAIWGVQARIQLCVNIISPSEDPEWADLAWLSGLVDFRRLRSDVRWPIAAARKADDAGEEVSLGEIKPIDSDADYMESPPLLRDFCSSPLPEIRVATANDGMLRYELLEGPIGKTAAVTCMVGIVGRKFVRRRRVEGDTIGEHNARLNTPAELLIHELYVHEDLEHALHPRALLYSQLPSQPSYPLGGRESGVLPLAEQVQSLGGGPPDSFLPELQEYSRNLQSVFDRLGWDSQRFHGFRLRLKYPPMPALAVMRYDLPAET
ncbi:MAG: hypothetical protein AAGF97_01450 [Planctomycetota bacterium]